MIPFGSLESAAVSRESYILVTSVEVPSVALLNK